MCDARLDRGNRGRGGDITKGTVGGEGARETLLGFTMDRRGGKKENKIYRYHRDPCRYSL